MEVLKLLSDNLIKRLFRMLLFQILAHDGRQSGNVVCHTENTGRCYDGNHDKGNNMAVLCDKHERCSVEAERE